MILIINNLYADVLEDFRYLSVDEKIQRILEEYRYEKNWTRLRFAQYASILAENPEESIPVLFKCLENLPMLPLTEDDKAYQLVDYILWRRFHMNGNLLKQSELNKLATIYQRKIYEYLETYKVVDIMIVLTETQIELIKYNRNIISNLNIGQILYEKYTQLGYKDLQLVYEPSSTGI